MGDPPAKFGMYGPCRVGGSHLIVSPNESKRRPFAGVECRLCWKCKSIFFWIVGPLNEDDDEKKTC